MLKPALLNGAILRKKRKQFSGQKGLHSMPLKKSGTTEFQEKVYRVLRKIPAGFVTTYGALASQAGCGSGRAVGQALRRNPYAPQVPCHRVIAFDLTIGGFCGKTAGSVIRRKKKLLEKEGVFFRNGKLFDCSRVWTY
jgi:methylated-DNA-[protein]-cysteine S-methyltransferase